ncbi:MAG TPA: glycosyltransferase family 25 protein [Rhizomicrobium sp.]|nr:glycosyltransferase family 25 protein [Rhizomicrobium sp.]
MRIYLINLARRPDRLAGMLRQAAPLGLNLERVEALDAAGEEPRALDRWFEEGGPLGEIPKGDKACLLSHRQAWRLFLESGDSHAAFLEDDVRLSKSAPALLLANSNWLPPDAGVMKLEHYGPPGQRVLLEGIRPLVLEPRQKALAQIEDFRIGRMLSRHTGAAAYILSRSSAELLMAENLFDLPVDHLLFNPNNSRLFRRLRPWQLLPAIARQEQDAASDIEGTRVGLRILSGAYVRRELVRFGYDLRLVPQQLIALLGGAKFVAVTTAS